MDKTRWVLAFCILPALCSVSLLTLHTPTQAAPTVTHESAATTMPPAPRDALDAGDREELREHWDTPKFAQEERLQIGGLVVLLAAAAGVSLRRRQSLRRSYRHV